MVPESSRPETREQRAQRLAPVAAQWAARLRDEDVDLLAAELLDPLPRLDLYGLLGLLGGAADTSVHPDIWWGWVRLRDVLETAAPIVWEEDEVPIEQLDSATLNGLIERLATEEHCSDDEIAVATGLTRDAVAARRRRAGVAPGLRRGDVRTARAGVG